MKCEIMCDYIIIPTHFIEYKYGMLISAWNSMSEFSSTSQRWYVWYQLYNFMQIYGKWQHHDFVWW